MNKDLKEKIKNYYQDMEIPEPNKNDILFLQSEAENNFNKSKKFRKLGIILVSSICVFVIAILSIVLPIVLKKNDDSDNDSYYSDDEPSQKLIQTSEAKSYINEHYNYLNFIFDECSINYIYGYYAGSKLYAIEINMEKNDIPFTTLDLNLVIDRNYNFVLHDTYISSAEIIEKENCIVYKKTMKHDFNEILMALIDYNTYRLYLNFNIDDEEFLQKFINN